MKFIPNSEIKKELLKELQISDIEELFSDIPKSIKIKDINLSKGLSQLEVENKLKSIGCKNKSFFEKPFFLGGGIKPHYIPALVKSIISRSEFYTSYTPYQPEASQGFLQAMFEYQSVISEITGMDVANASLYDGATALGEAALMCTRINKKNTFIIPKSLCWEKKSVLINYTKGTNIKIKEVYYDQNIGTIDVSDLENKMDNDVSGVYLENPNFFGIFEDKIKEINDLIKLNNSLFVVGIDPISLGVVKSPGEYDADIVIGEGRVLGNSIDFGGSSLGIFACKNEYTRQIPGRLIGMTKDSEGKRAFCMTLQTREQHIRRGKATSNICTNEGLNALAALVYLSWLGSEGLYNVSKQNFEKGQELAKKITSISGYKLAFSGIHFNEFVIKCPDLNKLNDKLLKKNIQGGVTLDKHFKELKNCMLFGISELYTDEMINQLISIIKKVQ